MPKITFMGAGSTVFARNVLGDCMCTPALRDSEIALYDIDAQRLEESFIILSAINRNINEGRAKISTYCGVENRKEALRGADAAGYELYLCHFENSLLRAQGPWSHPRRA